MRRRKKKKLSLSQRVELQQQLVGAAAMLAALGAIPFAAYGASEKRLLGVRLECDDRRGAACKQLPPMDSDF